MTANLAVLFSFSIAAAGVLAGEQLPVGVACLLEENASELLPKLTNPQGDLGEGEEERDTVFAGKSGVKITQYQKYYNLIPGWSYRITENPKVGEYRYLRFAWKADGLAGIMLQLHDDKDWHIRYTAGVNKFGWETRLVAETVPSEWTVVTVDLFKDFGEREIHGIALTAFDGAAGYFDHIYLARTTAELDAIDATVGNAATLPREEVEKLWQQLGSNDASVAYRSFWALVAAGGSTQQVLNSRISKVADITDEAAIRQWLMALDDDAFDVRERATEQLSLHIEQSRSLIEAELAKNTALEVRFRLGRILESANETPTDAERLEKQTQRILALIKQRAMK